MGNHDTKVGDCIGKCPGQTHKHTNSYYINIDDEDDAHKNDEDDA